MATWWLLRFFALVLMVLTITKAVSASPSVCLDPIVFGNVSFRSTNLFRSDYDFVGGWFESRVSVAEPMPRIPGIRLRPYGKLVTSLSNRCVYSENRLVYGAGLEIRPARNVLAPLDRGPLRFLSGIRLYGEALGVHYPEDEPRACTPVHDLRFGAELWAPFNVDLSARNVRLRSVSHFLWGEIWCDAGYRSSNFFKDNYDSWFVALVTRAGLRVPTLSILRATDVYFMPYVAVDFLISQWRYSWENRAIGILGFRLMPFQHFEAYWLQQIRFYVEYVVATDYFRNLPVPGTPDDDIRIGVDFSNAWGRH